MTDKSNVGRAAGAVKPESEQAAGELARSVSQWLTSGALQGDDGAIHAWIDRDTGARAFAYPEITGY